MNSSTTTRCVPALCILLISLTTLVKATEAEAPTADELFPIDAATSAVNYTCADFYADYSSTRRTCDKSLIGNGVCDNPNHGGSGGEGCRAQDCLDCNVHCQQFNADCNGCLNAEGCFYCPGDGTCNNYDRYSTMQKDKKWSCTKSSDYWKGGRDDPNDVCIPDDSFTEDPLILANNWYYEMINVVPVWKELNYTGRGITIRVNDNGVDPDHDDFEGKFDEAGSCDNFRPSPGEDHGTVVAGTVAAHANNDKCGAGIAYDASLSSCNVFAGGDYWAMLAIKLDTFDISQNSFGVTPCNKRSTSSFIGGFENNFDSCPFNPPSGSKYNPCSSSKCTYVSNTTTSMSSKCEKEIFRYCKYNFKHDEDICMDFLDLTVDGVCEYDKTTDTNLPNSLREGVTRGRDGKGTIFVVAAGNLFYLGEDTNMNGFTNSRYTMSVGAVGKDRLHTEYSTPGAALFISGPAGAYADKGHILTTGLNNQCTDSGSGTSYAAPIISGVVALMLEARPELTWRDIQGILAASSQKQEEPEDESAQTNAADFWHSNLYGFGIVDAQKAVEMALEWELWTPEYQIMVDGHWKNKPIPVTGKTMQNKLTVEPHDGFVTESVVVFVNMQHYTRGDLELKLVSPSGTESILHPGERNESTQTDGAERWRLMTVRNWGEDPSGVWNLKITDLSTDNNGVVNEFLKWDLVVYGRTVDGNPPTPIVSQCTDDAEFKYKDKKSQGCKWVSRNTKRRCKKKWQDGKVSDYCPVACESCPSDDCQDGDLAFEDDENKNCEWVNAKYTNLRCQKDGVADACPRTCGQC